MAVGLGDRPAIVDLTVPAGVDRRPRAGVCVHRCTDLPARDVRRRDGVPLTSPALTLVELAGVLPAGDLARALEEAEVHRLVRRADLERRLDGRHRRRGSAALRSALARHATPRLTRSAAERRLVELVRQARLPVPQTNVRVAGFIVDGLWRAERLVLEVDGFAFHGTRAAFERDRERDATLLAAGFRVLRVTWLQLEEEPFAVIARVAAALR